MTRVSIYNYTGCNSTDRKYHAARLLVATKQTRLNAKSAMSHALLMTQKELEDELEYMRKTIKSSWEFIDITFLIEGVTRACAQQITRTRTASYAMQSLRVVDASEIGISNPFNKTNDLDLYDEFEEASKLSKNAYNSLVSKGAKAEDARGILPLNTHSNIICKYNFRSFVDLVKARSSLRVQGEYSEIISSMKSLCIGVWPWSVGFFDNENKTVIEELERLAKEQGITPGHGLGWELSKLADLLR